MADWFANIARICDKFKIHEDKWIFIGHFIGFMVLIWVNINLVRPSTFKLLYIKVSAFNYRFLHLNADICISNINIYLKCSYLSLVIKYR